MDLEAVGPASVGWKLVVDGGLVAANASEGVVSAGAVETVALDVVEARLAVGRTQIDIQVFTTEEGGKCAAPSVPDTTTAYGYSCHHSTIPLVVDVAVSSGLVVFPSAHEVGPRALPPLPFPPHAPHFCFYHRGHLGYLQNIVFLCI